MGFWRLLRPPEGTAGRSAQRRRLSQDVKGAPCDRGARLGVGRLSPGDPRERLPVPRGPGEHCQRQKAQEPCEGKTVSPRRARCQGCRHSRGGLSPRVSLGKGFCQVMGARGGGGQALADGQDAWSFALALPRTCPRDLGEASVPSGVRLRS